MRAEPKHLVSDPRFTKPILPLEPTFPLPPPGFAERPQILVSTFLLLGHTTQVPPHALLQKYTGNILLNLIGKSSPQRSEFSHRKVYCVRDAVPCDTPFLMAPIWFISQQRPGIRSHVPTSA